MKVSEPIARTHLVLVGSGNAHVTVIRALGMRPEPGLVVRCVAKELEAPCSGMLPGLVAGHYTDGQSHIDVVSQTSGGLLAGVPDAGADRCLSALHAAGITNARIVGEVSDAAPARHRLRFAGTL